MRKNGKNRMFLLRDIGFDRRCSEILDWIVRSIELLELREAEYPKIQATIGGSR